MPSPLQNLILNYSKIASTTLFPADQIIGVKDGSISIGAAPSLAGVITAVDTFDTKFADTCYYQGIFSVDGGNTWNDLGSYSPNLSTPSEPVLQTVTCRGYVTAGGVLTMVGINWYDNVHSSSSAYTILYKVLFTAKATQGIITPIPVIEKTQYDTRYKYHKILTENSFPVSTSINTVIGHGLTYPPKVRSFFSPASATYGDEGVYQLPAACMATLDWFEASVLVDNADVTFTPITDNTGNIAGEQYYRIYIDG